MSSQPTPLGKPLRESLAASGSNEGLSDLARGGDSPANTARQFHFTARRGMGPTSNSTPRPDATKGIAEGVADCNLLLETIFPSTVQDGVSLCSES